MGELNVALLSSVSGALELAANDKAVDFQVLTRGLQEIAASLLRKAEDIEKRNYQPGNNYGFSGAADTSSEIYRYCTALARANSSAALLDAEGCANMFRGAMKIFGMYSADGDPMGAIGREIREAEELSANIIDEAFTSIPKEWENWDGEISADLDLSAEEEAEPNNEASSSSIDSNRSQVFISYSHRDRRWLAELQRMLTPLVRNGSIDVWDDTKITPGSAWKVDIEIALNSAKVAILLVSSNFLASDFIAHNELPPLLRASREEGLIIYWIYISSCVYEPTEISAFQAAHNISRALDMMTRPKRQAELAKICKKLGRLLS